MKTNFAWVKFGCELLRHLPTLDLYSALHGGFLRKLETMKNRPKICTYDDIQYDLKVNRTIIANSYKILEKYNLITRRKNGGAIPLEADWYTP